MLSVLTAHIIITVSCLWSGYLFYKTVGKNVEPRPIIFYAISGLILLTVFAQITVLFFPIGWNVQMVLAGILFLSILFKWNEFKEFYTRILSEFSSWPTLTLILFFLSWLLVLLINAGPVIMDDTESYHIQSIKWIREYGSVPGLVNLHERFGFNSSWFSSIALFGTFDKTSSGFTALNGVLSMWLCYWFISKYNQFKKENNLQGVLGMLIIFSCCLIIWPLIRGNAATANYDFITTCLVIILFTEIFFSTGKELSPPPEWIIWPVYLFTVRMINFPLLFLSLFALIFFIKQNNLKSVRLPVVYCLLLIVPLLVRNIIVAGYPFYPATNFDWANVDWKPDTQMTERLLEYIKYYNRVSTTYFDIEQTKALGPEWIPAWFQHLFLFDKVLVISGLTGILLSIVKMLLTKNKRVILLIPISLIWLICWFVISPDPRFVYGLLLFGVFLFVYYFISLIRNIQVVRGLANILIMVVLAGSAFYFISKLWKQNQYRNWVSPAQLPQPLVKEATIDGITFRIPDPINNNWNARCFGTPLPCIYKIDPRLKPRGKNIHSGFHLEK